MTEGYIKLSIAALLPVVFAALLYLIETKTSFSKSNKVVKQIVVGIVFGALAIVGTEWGIPMNGAQVNCRDAAVLCAGLFFGAPAGIIAGLIGGIERWIAVAWGIGTFTRVACTVSTIIAGLYAALLRKKILDNKRPGWLLAFAIGVVMEVFHLTMVFVTNLAESEKALQIVEACSAPMVIANGLSVMLSSMIISIIAKEKLFNLRRDQIKISDTVRKWLLVIVVIAFVLTSSFIYKLQDETALTQVDQYLSTAVSDVIADINDASDRNLLDFASKVVEKIGSGPLESIAKEFDVAEINIVDRNGIITESTNSSFIGFDMHSGAQSEEFLCLLGGESEYAQAYGPISFDAFIKRKYVGRSIGYGFVQLGYDARQFQSLIDEKVVGAVQNRHVGQKGYMIICNSSYDVISAPSGITATNLEDVIGHYNSGRMPDQGVRFEVNMFGEDCFGWYDKAEGYYIMSFMTREEAFNTRNQALIVNTFMEILVFAVLYFAIYKLIDVKVVKQIVSVNDSLKNIRNGNLDEVVSVDSNEEFAQLSGDINSTVDKLKEYIDEAAARIDADLKMATEIQESALPSVFPAFPQRKEFDIYALMNTAKEVGGDFYDFYLTRKHGLHMLIADVSGKGIPAAMFMMRAKTQLQSLTKAGLPIDEVFTKGNNALCEGNDAGMFVTAWQGGIELRTGLMEFANAGHNPPLVKKANGSWEYLRSKVNLVLAGMEDVPYKKQFLQLEPGDTLFLYTDGVTEATDAHNELYGETRLQNALNSKEFSDMKELCEFVKADVDKFVGDAPQFDDITMLAFKYFGSVKSKGVDVTQSFRTEAEIANMPAVMDFVEGFLDKISCPMKAKMQIDVAVDEIFTNIASYAYDGKSGPCIIEMTKTEDGVRLSFMDEGVPYNPLEHKDPDTSLSLDERSIGGLGILMVKKTMDKVSYEYENAWNVFTIEKHFSIINEKS